MKTPGANDTQGIRSDTSTMSGLTVLSTYMSQRFPIATYGGLSVYLLLFAVGAHQPDLVDALTFSFLLVFLFLMRLYDDLQNIRFDVHKTERIYVDPAASRKLYIFFLICAVVTICILLAMRPAMGMVLLAFLVSNHLLYTLLVNRAQWRYLLPLLKYPFVAALVTGDWSIANLSLFFAFLTFDIIDDPTFPLPRWTSVIWSLAAFTLLFLSESQNSPTVRIHVAAVASSITLVRKRYVAYAFLILLLIAKLDFS